MINRVSIFNDDAREATAIPKRIIADTRHAIRNRDARETTAIIERIIADARYAAVSRNYTILTSCNQGLACCFNQTIPRRMIDSISFFNRDTRETTASGERRITDARHAFRHRDAREDTAIIERIIADARYAFRNRDAREATAKPKRILANARHAFGNRDAREATAIGKRFIANARHAVFDDYCFDAISVAVPRHRGRGIVHHLPRAANRQRSAFVIKCPREVISVRATGATISFRRRRQNEKCRERSDEDDEHQGYEQ